MKFSVETHSLSFPEFASANYRGIQPKNGSPYNRLAIRAMTALVVSILWLSAPTSAFAETVDVTLQDNQFSPNKISVPAGSPFELRIKNKDVIEEIISIDQAHVEFVVTPGARVRQEMPALKAGSYELVGKMNPDTAKATLVAE